jgi:hypothetical protein
MKLMLYILLTKIHMFHSQHLVCTTLQVSVPKMHWVQRKINILGLDRHGAQLRFYESLTL